MCGIDSAWNMPAELLFLAALYDFDERPIGYTTFKGYTRAQWQSARIQLGLEPNPMEVTEEEDRAWQEKEKQMIGAKSKYHKRVKGVDIDVYDVLKAFNVTNPADAHAIKKMLCPGQRGVKDGIQDRKEAIASLERAIELESGQ